MSKLREQVPPATGELGGPAEPDLTAYVVFTQLRDGQPHVYAGWLDAPDDAMAVAFARDHYGRDQECVSLWVARRAFVAGLRSNEQASGEEVPRRAYRIFIQADSGDAHRSAGTVEATCAKQAIETAREQVDGAAAAHNLWAIPAAAIVATGAGEVIWRLTDQSYRLARGYSRQVREKWARIREEQALREYEKDDLEEAF